MGGGYVNNFHADKLQPCHVTYRKNLWLAQRINFMKPDPKIFDDISRVAGGAMNVFSAMREQVMGDFRARFDEWASRMDLVPREDFDRLEALVKKLQKQLDELSGAKAPAAKKTAKPATAAKKTSGKK